MKRILWVGRSPFEKELKDHFDLTVASGLEARDVRLGSCNVSAKALVRDSRLDPDLVVWSDGDIGQIVDLDQTPCRTACFFFDPHLLSTWSLAYSSVFDVVLSTQAGHLRDLTALGHSRHEWVPYWANLEARTPVRRVPLKSRPIDVAFIGHSNQPNQSARAAFLEKINTALGARLKLHIGAGPWDETYRKSKIVLNVPVGNDLNMRVFEAMASGAVLVSPGACTGMTDLFRSGADFVDYRSGNAADAAGKIEALLSDLPRAQEIADSGYLQTGGSHLFQHRARQVRLVLKKLATKSKNTEPREDRSFLMGRALVALVLNPPLVPANRWPEQFDRRLEMAESRLNLWMDRGEHHSEAAYLLALVEVLRRNHEGAVKFLEKSAENPALQILSLYGLSRIWRIIGDTQRANRFYPHGFRAGSLDASGTLYWDMLSAALTFELRDYQVALGTSTVPVVLRGPARERKVVSETVLAGSSAG